MALIPFDDRDGKIWQNGELIKWRDANIHILSHALHYGSCVFEGQRVYGGKIFKLRQHSERLIRSAERMQMTVPYTAEQLDAACIQAAEANNITEGYCRPVVWRGSEQMGVAAQKTFIHVAIACWEWPSYFSEEAKKNGIKLKTATWRRPPPDCAPTDAKAAGLYMICTLAKHNAEQEGYNDALMMDWQGRIAEATGANFFMVKDGVLHTPIADCFLNGITRQTVIELAQQRGIAVQERRIWPDEIIDAEEIFLTGSAAEVTPVGQIDQNTYTVGPITHQLLDDYSRLVRGQPLEGLGENSMTASVA